MNKPKLAQHCQISILALERDAAKSFAFIKKLEVCLHL